MQKAFYATAVMVLASLPAFAQAQSTAATSADQTFLMNTAKASLAEVELGKLAAINASSDQVKTFGQKMVDDHTKANVELRALAGSKNIVLPSDLDAQDKAAHDTLAALKGVEFDREYMAMMVAGHRKVADSLKKESTSGKDADVKAWASKTLPTVEGHLKMALEANRAVGTSGVKK
jgi:putative membrane protein